MANISFHFSAVRQDSVSIVRGSDPGSGLLIAFIFSTTSGGRVTPVIVVTVVPRHSPIFTGGAFCIGGALCAHAATAVIITAAIAHPVQKFLFNAVIIPR
jgi:hypothetical protein